jgi:acyl-CoA synthetase (AMP-forming)/AMP-acid ligase II
MSSGFKNLGDLIRDDADLTKIAIIDLGGEEPPVEYTYAELDGMAMAVARALTRRGLSRGDRVAVLSANRAEFVAAYFGIMRAGFVAVPVNYRFPRKTIHLILENAGAKLLFCDTAGRDDCPEGLPAVVFGAEGDGSFGRFIDPGEFETVIPDDREPAMFLYTSGSTGLPKGVVLSHQSHIWVVETRLAPDLDRHRYLIAAPLYHMNALALSKLACAAHATVVLLPRFEAKSYIEAIGHYRPTWLTAVPPMIAMMLRERATMENTDLSSVEFIRMGSAPVSEALMAATHKAFPKARVTNAYGTTEAGPVVFGPHPKGLPQPEDSVGYPHPKVQLRLSQPAGREAAVHRGRLLHHRRRVPPRRRRLPLFPRPHRRHVRLGRREHLSGRRRAHAGTASRRQPGRGDPGRRRHQGHQAGRLRHPEGGTQAHRRHDQDLCAGERAGLPAPALRLVRRRIAARLHQQGGSRRPAPYGARTAHIISVQFFKPDAARIGRQRAISALR